MFVAFALLIALTRFFALQPQVAVTATFDHASGDLLHALGISSSARYSQRTDGAPAKADPEFSPQPIISVPPEADNRDAHHRHSAQRQAEARCRPAQHRGLVEKYAKAAAGDPSGPADARGRHYPHRAPLGKLRRPATLRHGPTDSPSQFAHAAELCRGSAARPARFERGRVPGSATCGHRTSAKCRDRIHSSARRTQHRPEFRDCSRAATSSRRTARHSRISLSRPRRTAPRSSASRRFPPRDLRRTPERPAVSSR